jgi:predicted PurR-regulated permease PerM
MRFIPVVGVWCAALLPAALAVALFDHWSPLLYVAILFAATEATVNFAVEPWLYGLSTGISGIAVLIAILFWTWIWGPLGLLLAVPITVCLVVLGKHLEPLRVFYVILGDEPVLAGQTRLYHRLVAGDLASAEQIVDAAMNWERYLATRNR